MKEAIGLIYPHLPLPAVWTVFTVEKTEVDRIERYIDEWMKQRYRALLQQRMDEA